MKIRGRSSLLVLDWGDAWQMHERQLVRDANNDSTNAQAHHAAGKLLEDTHVPLSRPPSCAETGHGIQRGFVALQVKAQPSCRGMARLVFAWGQLDLDPSDRSVKPRSSFYCSELIPMPLHADSKL